MTICQIVGGVDLIDEMNNLDDDLKYDALSYSSGKKKGGIKLNRSPKPLL